MRWLLVAALFAATGPATAADPALLERCGVCHGADGRSAMPGVPSLAGQPADFITLQMILFREGLRDVPPMTQFAEGLSDGTIEALAGHFSRLPPAPAVDRAPRDAALIAAGAALSAGMNCGVCHLPDYRGRAQIPRLAGQREEYLLAALRAYRDNARVGTDTNMNAVVYGVSDASLAALAHYLAHSE